MTKKQHYMKWEERIKLEAYYNDLRLPVSQIAAIMGFCRQTIYNELQLGKYMHTVNWWDEERYSAEKAQQKHDWNQSGKGRPEKIGSHHDYAKFLEEKILKEHYSPAAALAASRRMPFSINISVGTLYNYIYKGLFMKLSAKDLWEKPKRGKKKAAREKRTPHPLLPQISDRPKGAADRTEPGHWEMDLVVGAKGTEPVLLTLTERSSRREMIFKLPNRRAATVRAVFDRLEREMKRFKEIFKTITTDNGSEFLEYDKLTESIYGGKRFEVYYCHSYAAWEKGTNENHNRMIRRFFPKGTNFAKVTKKRIAEIQNWMNNYPRKVLGWLTPIEYWHCRADQPPAAGKPSAAGSCFISCCETDAIS